jgi:lipopolysaccharide export system protein LptA
VLHQGQNVIRGKQLVVDMKTGVAQVLGGTSGLFVPSKDQQGAKPKPKTN